MSTKPRTNHEITRTKDEPTNSGISRVCKAYLAAFLFSGIRWNFFQITHFLKLRKQMLLLRLYVVVLTLVLLCVFCFTRGIGPLEGTVIVCPLLFLILDMHTELREFRQLERRLTDFLARH